ncbi:hypothetical protein MTP99_008499 [Tenebrio molitor]|nr:hypothetical protein MTP99_008499 [Tenebrio molitor]
MSRSGAIQTVINLFIANLALSAILLCVLAVPFIPLHPFLDNWVFGNVICHLVPYVLRHHLSFPFAHEDLHMHRYQGTSRTDRARSGARSSGASPPPCRSSRRKATESPSIIIVVVIFLVSWLLLHAISFVNGFYHETSNWEYYPFSFFPIHALAMSFTCYNPFLYAWLNENVCKEFKESCQPEGRLVLVVTQSRTRLIAEEESPPCDANYRVICGPRVPRRIRSATNQLYVKDFDTQASNSQTNWNKFIV